MLVGRGGARESGMSRKRHERILKKHQTQAYYKVITTIGIMGTLAVFGYVLMVYIQSNDIDQLLLIHNEEEGSVQGVKEEINADTHTTTGPVHSLRGAAAITSEIKELVKSVLPNRANNDFIGLEEVGPSILRKTVHKLDIDKYKRNQQPLVGDIVTNGSKPLFGLDHQGRDAVFALACNYPILYYKRFVGSLRKAGFDDDIVLAVSPPQKMRTGVEEYLKRMDVISYAFEVDCQGKDNCKFKDDFLGYPDPRPFRTFANMRYGLYEFWMRFYNPQSNILILDFRDTFFQSNPFIPFGPYGQRNPKKYELHLYAENWDVKSIGKCGFNSLWIGRCFSKASLAVVKPQAVICSGSTLGNYMAIDFYIATMLSWMDTIMCWKKGIESDQGYQNYLFYNGHFHTQYGNATLNYQGNGVVNTIGAMNGKRVPKDKKGTLKDFWKIIDNEGYVLNNDGTRSACVHQWDRFYSEMKPFLDKNLLEPGSESKYFLGRSTQK